jgi:hypothetical protein
MLRNKRLFTMQKIRPAIARAFFMGRAIGRAGPRCAVPAPGAGVAGWSVRRMGGPRQIVALPSGRPYYCPLPFLGRICADAN